MARLANKYKTILTPSRCPAALLDTASPDRKPKKKGDLAGIQEKEPQVAVQESKRGTYEGMKKIHFGGEDSHSGSEQCTILPSREQLCQSRFMIATL